MPNPFAPLPASYRLVFGKHKHRSGTHSLSQDQQLLIKYNTFCGGQALSLIKHSAKPAQRLCCLSSDIFHDSHTVIPRCIDPLLCSLWGFGCGFQPSEHSGFCERLMATLQSYSHCQKLLRHTLYASS